METQDFDFDAGALCLDFANTVDWHASDRPHDRLQDYFDLIAWAQAANILLPDQADRLCQMAREQPQLAETVFARAIRLREATYRLFVDFFNQESCHDDDLALLNEVLSESLTHLQLVPSSAGFEWDWDEGSIDFDQILWPVARSAGELLTSQKLERVSQCADDRGCGYLFVDTSRNRSRRWCSMESCGNRAKAQRHYRRQQKKQ